MGEMMLTGRWFSFTGSHLRHALMVFPTAQVTLFQNHTTNRERCQAITVHGIAHVSNIATYFMSFPIPIPCYHDAFLYYRPRSS
jgi:hypothetical protein